MAVYSVHLPSARPDATEAAFVRDGFSWPAFFFGPLWLLARRFWLAAALWCAAALILLSLIAAGALSGGAGFALALLLQIFLGLEAGRLIESRLWRQGFNLAEIVAAPRSRRGRNELLSPARPAGRGRAGAPGPRRRPSSAAGSSWPGAGARQLSGARSLKFRRL